MSSGPVPIRESPRKPSRGDLAPVGNRSWLEERLGLAGLEQALLGGQMPGGASFWHALGSVAAGLFVLEAVTGIFLSLYYAPSVQTAWGSVAYIQDQLPLGWFLRGLHSFGSSALIVVVGLHLLQVLLFGAYRKPRELNWIIGLGLFGVTVLVRAVGLPPAVGPKGLLGQAGGGDDHRQRAGRRRLPPSRSCKAGARSAT